MQWHEPLPNNHSNHNNNNNNSNSNNNNSNDGSNAVMTPRRRFPSMLTPTIKNHSVTYYEHFLYCFGGYDGRMNHSNLVIFDLVNKSWFDGDAWVKGSPPPGRNGHTATLATESGKIIIIGGWLGSGPLAASDMHVLYVKEGPVNLRWSQPEVKGTPPGPCNMHSADYVESRKEVYVFRGGNGREYLNDLHALHTDRYEWRKVETLGSPPQPRANHSSAFLNETEELFIFGGWNGRRRLNDIHILDVATSSWSTPHVSGVIPHARAGMTLTALRDRLYLFGGSGTSSKCFDDLQILDRNKMTWLDVSAPEDQDEKILVNSRSSSFRSLSFRKSNRQDEWIDDHLMENSNANPNDEEIIQQIYLQGKKAPGKRAGHTATAVHNRYIYIFGGSCGSDYLNDFFSLDTDPPPPSLSHHPTTLQLFERRLQSFYNTEEFSDVTFLVEGQRVFGHRMVLSLVSDCFRAMFTTRNSFKEAQMAEIEIPNCSYSAFMLMMEYIYTGREPLIMIDSSNMSDGIGKAIEILELADQFFLERLKAEIERTLRPFVNHETFDFFLEVAQKANASQLEMLCLYFERNQDNIVADVVP